MVVAATAGALGLVSAARSGDPDQGARVGDVLDSTDEVDGVPIAFPLPPGAFEVTVAPATRTPDLTPVDDEVPAQAAPGSSYVAVSWGWQDLSDGRDALPVRTFLVVDGRRYAVAHRDERLDRPFATSSVAVVVPGESPDVSVEVDYDGLTLRADADSGLVEPGPADGLDQPASTTALDPYDRGIPDGFVTDMGDNGAVDLTVRRTTYVVGLGWADEGTEYLVATLVRHPGTLVLLDPEERRRRREVEASYRLDAFAGRVTLAGEGPGTRLAGQPARPLPTDVVETRAWVVEVGAPVTATARTRADAVRDYAVGATVPKRLRLTGSVSTAG